MGIDYIRKDRGEFESGLRLKLSDLPETPMPLFEDWLQEAIDGNVIEPNAMNVSTVDENGFPHSRIVYLRDVDRNQLTFYSNYSSLKAKNVLVNPRVASLFFWPELHKQVRIEGKVLKSEESVSDKYFESRPRTSQLGAWASHQSDVLESREILEKRLADLEKQFEGKTIPRPEGWGGYIIIADYYEFWLGQPSRLHDRIVYRNEHNKWIKYRLNP